MTGFKEHVALVGSDHVPEYAALMDCKVGLVKDRMIVEFGMISFAGDGVGQDIFPEPELVHPGQIAIIVVEECKPNGVIRVIDDLKIATINHGEGRVIGKLHAIRRRSENGLTHADYEAIGMVDGALAQYAEAAFARLDEGEQADARRIFIQLVRPGEGTEDTRRLASRVE